MKNRRLKSRSKAAMYPKDYWTTGNGAVMRKKEVKATPKKKGKALEGGDA